MKLFIVASSIGETTDKTTVELFNNWVPKMQELYISYSPVKPSDYLTKEEIIRLKELLEKPSGSKKEVGYYLTSGELIRTPEGFFELSYYKNSSIKTYRVYDWTTYKRCKRMH